jgi:hypothetical protein
MPSKLTAVIITSFCLIPPVNAADPPKQQKIRVLISPECKGEFYAPDFVDLDATGKMVKEEKRAKPDYQEWDPTQARPWHSGTLAPRSPSMLKATVGTLQRLTVTENCCGSAILTRTSPRFVRVLPRDQLSSESRHPNLQTLGRRPLKRPEAI